MCHPESVRVESISDCSLAKFLTLFGSSLIYGKILAVASTERQALETCVLRLKYSLSHSNVTLSFWVASYNAIYDDADMSL